jgi:hypothetical protein
MAPAETGAITMFSSNFEVTFPRQDEGEEPPTVSKAYPTNLALPSAPAFGLWRRSPLVGGAVWTARARGAVAQAVAHRSSGYSGRMTVGAEGK